MSYFIWITEKLIVAKWLHPAISPESIADQIADALWWKNSSCVLSPPRYTAANPSHMSYVNRHLFDKQTTVCTAPTK